MVLSYDYGAQTVVLEDATGGDISPHHYAMCLRCAEKLKPPRGWTVDDRRVAVPLFASERSGRHAASPTPAFSHRDESDADEIVADSGRQLFFGSAH